jgi:RNA polymerase-binding transcription factor DksA
MGLNGKGHERQRVSSGRGQKSKQMRAVYQDLLGLRAKILAQLSTGDEIPPLPFGGDAIDQANDGSAREVGGKISENSQRILKEINAAIERYGEGTLGVCEECGRRIAAARLRVLAYARRCIRCERSNAGRPHTNDSALSWDDVPEEEETGCDPALDRQGALGRMQ